MSQVTATNTLGLNFSEGLSYGIGQSQNISIPLAFRSLFKVYGGLLDQCNLVHCKTYTLAASTPQTINLQSLLDIFGNSVDLARVRFIAIRNNSQVDGQVLQAGGAGTDPWVGLCSSGTATVPIYPSTANNDGFAIFQMPNSTGAAVGPTNCNLELNPGSNAYTVDVLIAGCDA